MFTGSNNRACDRESRADHGKRKWRVHTDTYRDEQRRQGRGNSDSGVVQEPTEDDAASRGWTDHLIRNFTSVWKQDTNSKSNEGRQAKNGGVKGRDECRGA